MTLGRLAASGMAPAGASPAAASGDAARDLWAAAAGLLGLAAVVALRWALIVDRRLGGIAIGLVFGLGLTAVGIGAARLVAGARPRRSDAAVRLRAAVGVDALAGVGGGLALVALALVARGTTGPAISNAPGLGPASVFGPWLVVTVLVGLAEELVLRGALFTALERMGGPWLALAVTSAAFAVMHVPVYGWHVVPLDLGVGIFLGGLRLATGRWLAPGIAHVIADLATWWL